MIELENVTKYYKINGGKHYILKNVSIVLPENKNIGILGKNGAGKSTLLKMLGQINKPDKGKISSDKSFSWPMALSGGFQPTLSGEENSKFVCRIYGLSENELKAKLNFIKEFSELGKFFEQPVKTYSSGMKSRLSFALSLVFDFNYLLIDETLSVGDKSFQQKSKKALIDKIEKSNVLMVSHVMSILKEICDCGILLKDGDLLFFETIEEAIKEYEKL